MEINRYQDNHNDPIEHQYQYGYKEEQFQIDEKEAEDHICVHKPIKKSYKNIRRRTKKRKWTKKEDEVLLKLVQRFGQRYKKFKGKIQGKTPKNCRERWVNVLKPELNGRKQEWSLQESWILYIMQRTFGNKWASIASLYTNRSENDVKNHHNTKTFQQQESLLGGLLEQIIKNNNLMEIISQYSCTSSNTDS